VSFHNSETKQQSKPWLEKGLTGPVKAKLHLTRTKQMVIAFFSNKSLLYTSLMPRETMVNTNYIMEALCRFMKISKQKRVITAAGERFFHWDNAPVHTAAVVTDWMAVRHTQALKHGDFLLDLTPTNFFLFPRVKMELPGLTHAQQTFKKE